MLPVWLPVILGGVSLLAIYRTLQKSLLSTYTVFELALAANTLTAAALAPLAAHTIVTNLPALTPRVVTAISVSAIANVVYLTAFFKAAEHEDLSVIVPVTGILPVIVALLEPLVFNATYSARLLAATAVVVIGVYLVLLDDDYTTPFRRLTTRGPQFALISTAALAIALLADSYVATALPPVGYAGILTALQLPFFAAILYTKNSSFLKTPQRLATRSLLTFGAVRGASLILLLTALSLISATKHTLFLQLVPVITVFIGGTILNEDHMYRRLTGALVVFAGVALAM